MCALNKVFHWQHAHKQVLLDGRRSGMINGFFRNILVATPSCFPNITLAPSVPKETISAKDIESLFKRWVSVVMIQSAVPHSSFSIPPNTTFSFPLTELQNR
eukprot:Pompholyxophrys_punicea_v1_NODE_543_length_1718_cov_2.881539.p4 type:complete len:102 gc:universal NODE_543_length_1718_cov_2.881539:544-849(+)